MNDQANSDVIDNPVIIGLPATSELKAMFAEHLDGAKEDILADIQESVDQIYAVIEYVESETEDAQAQVSQEANTDTAVATKIDNFIMPKASDPGEGSSCDSFESLDEEFSVAEKNSSNR